MGSLELCTACCNKPQSELELRKVYSSCNTGNFLNVIITSLSSFLKIFVSVLCLYRKSARTMSECWLFMARRFLPVVPMPFHQCVPADRSVLPLLRWWRGLDTCSGEGHSFGRTPWLQRICSKYSWTEMVLVFFFGSLWSTLGQWVYLQVGNKKPVLWVSWIWTKCYLCKP